MVTKKFRSRECVFCKLPHKSEACRKASETQARRDYLMKNRRCYIYLSDLHLSAGCPDRVKCSKCNNGFHHVAICNGGSSKSTTATSGTTGKCTTFLQTFTSGVQHASERLTVRGFLDPGSDTSYVEHGLLRRLGIQPGPPRFLGVQGFGSASTTSVQVQDVRLILIDRYRRTHSVHFLAIDCLAGHLKVAPPPAIVGDLLPSGWKYADPHLFSKNQARIEVLLGGEVYYDFVNINGNCRLDSGLVLLKSVFGWVPAGSANLIIENETQTVGQTLVSAGQLQSDSSDPNSKELNMLLKGLWDLETLGIKMSEFTDISVAVIDQFRATYRIEGNRFVVFWPWKRPKEELNIPTNYRLCVARLKNTLKTCSMEVKRMCEEKFREQQADGTIELVTGQSHHAKHYLPFRPIIKEGKLRIVYDASAKTQSGQSLNDFLHAGPSLTQSLVGQLISFRLRAIGLTSDIEKAFLRVGLDESEQDVVRFLWVEDYNRPIDGQIKTFRFKRVPFGVVSSPFLLNMVMQEMFAIELQSGSEDKEIYLKLRNSFYVDNLVMSVDTVEEAERVFRCSTSLLQKSGMNLRDWTSNNPEFCRSLPAESAKENSQTVKMLGLKWDREADTLYLNIKEESEPKYWTKRALLSATAQIFDPLGYFSPCELAFKLLIQECWANKITWDEPLPSSLTARVRKLMVERAEMLKVPVPRRIWSTASGNCSYQLHVFCDASRKAYGCAAYLIKKNSRTQCSNSGLLYTKSRLASCRQQGSEQIGGKYVRPNSKQAKRRAARMAEQSTIRDSQEGNRSIPQLELLGATCGARIIRFLLPLLEEKGISVEHSFLWTDATTILQWLHSVTVLPQFVTKRIQEIKEVPNCTVCYVPTAQNPADYLTRGKTVREITGNNLWWYGPEWLSHPDKWPQTPVTTTPYSTATAVTLLSSLVTTKTATNSVGLLSDALEKRYLHWDCYIRTFSKLRQGILKGRLPKYNLIDESKRSEIALLKALQLKYFAREIIQLQNNCQPNPQLDLFLDENGLIRCRGRLLHANLPWDSIHPILLPRESRLVEVLLNTIHRKNIHLGAAHLLAKFREKFWISKGRAKVNSIVKRCKWCRRITGGPFKTPPMPALPKVRVADVAAFMHTGLDCFGPFYVTKPHSDKTVKVYGVIFTCLVVRAIHLELVENLSADQFLLAFIRFTSRRGKPSFVLSDNGTNFTFAQPLISKRVNLHEVKILDPKVRSHFISERIQWSFTPSLAPWYGGGYERLIGCVKVSLSKALGKSLVSFTTLMTIFCKVEDLVNSRPLTYVSSEDTIVPLTPNHFLRLREVNVTDEAEMDLTKVSPSSENLVAAVQVVKEVLAIFRETFHSQYLLALRQVHKSSHYNTRSSVDFKPTPGTVVLIREGLAPRSQWPVGIVKQVDPRGAIAQVQVNQVKGDQVKQVTLQRPVLKLYPFEIPDQPTPTRDTPKVTESQSKSQSEASNSLAGDERTESDTPEPKRRRRH